MNDFIKFNNIFGVLVTDSNTNDYILKLLEIILYQLHKLKH